jgi:hypothetical protein
MTNKKENKKSLPNASLFETLAITDNTYTDPVTGAVRPGIELIKQAKDWVDENEL